MAEDRSPLQEAATDSRPSTRHKWRGKLFSTEGRFGRNVGDMESTEDDVANFLQTASTRPRVKPLPGQLAPRIDTTAAPRYPAAVDISDPPTVVDVYRTPKPRQNKGLQVTFQKTAPEIIGEGGDEADLPPKDVSKSVINPHRPERSPRRDPQIGVKDEAIQSDQGPSPVLDDDGTFQPKPLQRTPTGLSEIFGEDFSDSRESDPDTNSISTSASPPVPKPRPQPPRQTLREREYESEVGPGQPHSNVVNQASGNSLRGYGGSGPFFGTEGHDMPSLLDVPSSEVLAGNSVTPRQSPQPVDERHENQASHYGFPSKASDTHIPLQSLGRKHESETQAISEPTPASKIKPFSLRQLAKDISDDSLDDFDSRVRRFDDIFRLGVSTHTDLMRVSFVQWIRAACWWFLRGRQGLEGEVRNKSSTPLHTEPSTAFKQAYVNLAKAWWIVKEITPNHPEITKYGKASMNSLCAMIRSFGDQTLAKQSEVHMDIVANMRALTMSMKRNGRLPPSDLEMQGLDLHVLLELPQLPPDLKRHLANNKMDDSVNGKQDATQSFFPIPVGDTERHFNFGRMFVQISILSSNSRQDLRAPCILSVLRDRKQWGVQAVIASQDGQIDLIISDEMPGALPWKAVQWQIQSHEMVLAIPEDSNVPVRLPVKFAERDFKTLWGICDYTDRTRKNFSAHRDEELVFERTLQNFQCDDAAHFPSDSIPGCHLRVFEKKTASSEPSAQDRRHNGHRLTVMTPPSMKTLSAVNFVSGRENPVLFRLKRVGDGSRLVLRVLPSSMRVSFGFVETEDMDTFRHILSGTLTSKEDQCFSPLQLQNLTIDINRGYHETEGMEENVPKIKLPWNKLRMVKKRLPTHSHETSPMETGNLRLFADSAFGTLTDRLNLTLGELQLGLSIDNFNQISLLRPAQSDMTWSLADERVTKEEVNFMCAILKDMHTVTTRRTYHFSTLEDLHVFQNTVTAFSVLFDGLASNFAISRRRSVVPVHKKWETHTARLQVLKRDKIFQLLGFFKDFPHGTCLNFVLKVTDVFEVFSKAGLFFLRIVDAKFALPKGQDSETRDLVCLDMPEYPSEHDDIIVGFDNEKGVLHLSFHDPVSY